MVGGPPQQDLFDYKPVMDRVVRQGPARFDPHGAATDDHDLGPGAGFPSRPSKYSFAQHGECGMWVCELLPWTAKMVDDMVFIRSMHTEAINHEPAISFMQTGNQITGRPCLGAWTSYGLGSLNENLPTFVVLVARPTNTEQVQAISARLWSAGYLPGEHAGVSFRTSGDPILFINNPPGVPGNVRRQTLDGLKALNELTYEQIGDEETRTRIQQYELAYRMQSSVPDLTDLASESESTFQLYGEEAKKPGHVCQHGPVGSAHGGTRRAFRPDLPQQLGYARERRRPTARPMPGCRPGRATPWCRILSNADCWTRHWSSGAANSAAPSTHKAACPKRTTAAIIILAASPCGWPEAA